MPTAASAGPRRLDRKRSAKALTLGRTQGRALLVMALAGVAVSAYLTYVHHRLLQEPEWRSACEINATVSCGTVLLSPYGSVAGVPLAFLAVCFYALAGSIAGSGMRIGRRGRPRSPPAALFVLSAFSVLLSVGLALVSILVIGTFCAFCALLYVINLGMFAVAWRALRGSGEDLRDAIWAERRYWRRHPNRGRMTGAILAVVVVAVMLRSILNRHEPDDAFCEAVSEVPVSNPIELVIYSDFQCPHCQELDRSLRAFRKEVRLETVLRHHPLDSTCNPEVKRSRHPNACLQARAAICAAKQERDEEFTDRLFDGGVTNQAGLVTLALSLGLDEDRFAACLAADETTRELEASIAAARANGVKATPTVFVNGRKHVGRLSKEDLSCLQQALRN